MTDANAGALIVGGHVLTAFDSESRPQWRRDCALLVRSGNIEEIGPSSELQRRYPFLPVTGGPGFVVMPGMVNAHHHVGITPFQLGSVDHPLELWLASRLALRDVDLELDTLYSAMEMVSSGVTTVQHLHSRAPGDTAQVLKAANHVISAYRRLGMRASYSMAVRDQNRIVYGADGDFTSRVAPHLRAPLSEYFDRFTLPLTEQVRIFQELRALYRGQAMTAIQLAPANLHWLSDTALETVAELAWETGSPMHMHLVETPYQREYARRRTGGTAVEYLSKFGLLTKALTIGHGVWMSESDIDICAAAGVHVCHNCSSNMRLASGRAPITQMLQAGIKVAIGIDEAGLNDDRDMLQELRLVHIANRRPGIDSPKLAAAEVLRMATEYGAGTTAFAGSIGCLEVGRAADLVMLDWKTITYPYQSTDISIAEVIVQRAKVNAVHSVMIGGLWVLRDHEFVTVDRDAILSEISNRLSANLSQSELSRLRFANDLRLEVRKFYDGYLGVDGFEGGLGF